MLRPVLSRRVQWSTIVSFSQVTPLAIEWISVALRNSMESKLGPHTKVCILEQGSAVEAMKEFHGKHFKNSQQPRIPWKACQPILRISILEQGSAVEACKNNSMESKSNHVLSRTRVHNETSHPRMQFLTPQHKISVQSQQEK